MSRIPTLASGAALVGILMLGALLNASPANAQTIGMVTDEFVDFKNNVARVTVFDADSNTVLGSVELSPAFSGPASVDCSITPDQTLGFVTDFGNQRVWVIDLTGPTPELATGTNPIQLGRFAIDSTLSSDGNFLLVSGISSPISVIDIAGRSVIGAVGSSRAVEACDDDSVLVTDINTVKRFSINAAGNLIDTGEVSNLTGAFNTACVPNSSTFLSLQFQSVPQIASLQNPGLGVLDTLVSPAVDVLPISAVVSRSGEEFFVRTRDRVQGFNYDPLTGQFGARFLDITTPEAIPSVGVDQLALHPDETKLYVSRRGIPFDPGLPPEPGAVDVYDIDSGALVAQIEDENILFAQGICLAAVPAAVPNAVTFLVIDDGSIDNGAPAIVALADQLGSTPAFLVNDGIAAPGLRTELPIPISTELTLGTGQVGGEGWHALKTIPASWDAAGPDDGLRNYVNAAPGLGTEGDPEALLDKIPDVTPLRTAGLQMLLDKTGCALVYDSNVSVNYDPLQGNLGGPNLGLIAFTVMGVGDPVGSVLPPVDIVVEDTAEVCAGPLELFEDAPEIISSSEPSP